MFLQIHMLIDFKTLNHKIINISIPFLQEISHFGDSDGLEEPMSFFAQTLNWYSRPGIMLQTVNLLLKMRSATVCHCLLLESRLVTMQCSLSSRFSSGDGVHETVTVPGTFSSSSTGPGGLGSSGVQIQKCFFFSIYGI